ncbi:MAG: divalent-cation tolerance protein CutA [candidate division Zixibacteria bacterium]|nr:divalent-cation tolerance protein CutA [candidate division Zixibacteria bacterium]MDD5426964.1 divalent-cation tolerance protein CutA [candidate division Zixibacteria bacterium]
MKTIRVVYISIPRDEARNLSRGIVENRLAACVNIIPKIESYFWWEDKVQFDEESLLIVKTTDAKFNDLMEYVLENHPYELPEIIGLPLVAAFPDYIAYVKTETEKE